MTELRRRTLLAGLGVGALGIVGFAGLEMTSSETELVRSILDRLVGPFNMRKPQFDSFVSDLDTYRGRAGDLKMSGYRALSSGYLQWAPDVVPDRIGDEYDRYERKVLTNFLVRTDYLQLGNPQTDFVTMIGEAPCRSPFAQFDMA